MGGVRVGLIRGLNCPDGNFLVGNNQEKIVKLEVIKVGIVGAHCFYDFGCVNVAQIELACFKFLQITQ